MKIVHKIFFTTMLVTNFISTGLAQNEEFVNTYVNTFNNYFYPFGNDSLNSNSLSYNPYLQFGLFYPYGRDACLPINNNSDPYDDSRFNIVNHYFPIVQGWSPDLYCNKGIENGPGINDSGSVRISVRGIDDNAGGIPNDGTDVRSRVEMIYYPKHFANSGYTANVENETYYYRWNFYIPNDSRFEDDIVYDDKGKQKSFHIISQFHQPDRVIDFDASTGIKTIGVKNNLIEGDQPPLFINYIHSENNLNNKRDIGFLYGYRNNTIETGSNLDRSSNFILKNGINKGEWNTIVLEIKWSPFDEVGYMKAWVNGQVVYGNPEEILTEKGNPNYETTTPEIIKGANMVLSQEGNPLSNYMQMGHYREHLDTQASIFFDDLIVTQNRGFAFSGFKTSLKTEFCGETIDAESYRIEAIKLPKISQYKFRFESINTPNNILEVVRNTNVYNLKDNESFFKPSTNYRVKVKVKVKGETNFRNYDMENNCVIKIPSFTKLIPQYCGGTLDVTDMYIQCYEVLNTTNYKFHFKAEPPFNEEFYIDSSSPIINLRLDNRFRPHRKYFVEVRAQGPNFDFDYGAICDIRIPQFTRLRDNLCNQTFSVNDNINCYRIPGATGYIFRFTNNLTNAQKWIFSNTTGVAQIPSINYFLEGGEYTVHVRENTGGYNLSCTINVESGGLIFNKPISNQQNQNLINSDLPYIYPNPASNELFVETPKGMNGTGNLYDTTGKLVLSFILNNQESRINVESLAAGIYFLEISGNTNTIVKKVVIE